MKSVLIYHKNPDIFNKLIHSFKNDDEETKQYVNKTTENMKYTVLMLTCENSRILHSENIIEILIKFGANINAQNINFDTPLIMSVDYSSRTSTLNTVKILLKNNADVNLKNEGGHAPLIFSFNTSCDENITKLLLDNGAYVVSDSIECNKIIRENMIITRLINIMDARINELTQIKGISEQEIISSHVLQYV